MNNKWINRVQLELKDLHSDHLPYFLDTKDVNYVPKEGKCVITFLISLDDDISKETSGKIKLGRANSTRLISIDADCSIRMRPGTSNPEPSISFPFYEPKFTLKTGAKFFPSSFNASNGSILKYENYCWNSSLRICDVISSIATQIRRSIRSGNLSLVIEQDDSDKHSTATDAKSVKKANMLNKLKRLKELREFLSKSKEKDGTSVVESKPEPASSSKEDNYEKQLMKLRGILRNDDDPNSSNDDCSLDSIGSDLSTVVMEKMNSIKESLSLDIIVECDDEASDSSSVVTPVGSVAEEIMNRIITRSSNEMSSNRKGKEDETSQNHSNENENYFYYHCGHTTYDQEKCSDNKSVNVDRESDDTCIDTCIDKSLEKYGNIRAGEVVVVEALYEETDFDQPERHELDSISTCSETEQQYDLDDDAFLTSSVDPMNNNSQEMADVKESVSDQEDTSDLFESEWNETTSKEIKSSPQQRSFSDTVEDIYRSSSRDTQVTIPQKVQPLHKEETIIVRVSNLLKDGDLDCGKVINMSEHPFDKAHGVFRCKMVTRPAFMKDQLTKEEILQNYLKKVPSRRSPIFQDSYVMIIDDKIVEIKRPSNDSLDSLWENKAKVVLSISMLSLSKIEYCLKKSSLSLFFKEDSKGPLLYETDKCADVANTINAVMKSLGTNGKYRTPSMEKARRTAVKTCADIACKQKAMSEKASVAQIREIIKLYCLAAEKFEFAIDDRSSIVVNHLKRFLANPRIAYILATTKEKVVPDDVTASTKLSSMISNNLSITSRSSSEIWEEGSSYDSEVENENEHQYLYPIQLVERRNQKPKLKLSNEQKTTQLQRQVIC